MHDAACELGGRIGQDCCKTTTLLWRMPRCGFPLGLCACCVPPRTTGREGVSVTQGRWQRSRTDAVCAVTRDAHYAGPLAARAFPTAPEIGAGSLSCQRAPVPASNPPSILEKILYSTHLSNCHWMGLAGCPLAAKAVAALMILCHSLYEMLSSRQRQGIPHSLLIVSPPFLQLHASRMSI